MVRVVLHVTESDAVKWAGVMSNVENLLKEFREDIEIEVVANGDGIGFCQQTSPDARHVAELIGKGVVVAACENTLRAQGISVEQLVPGCSTVSSGVGEVVRRQVEGWCYIRP